RLWRMPKPTLAALPGPAAGGGLGLALACDLRYGCERTLLTTSFARVGLSGDYGVAWQLTRLVGTARARELMFFADRVDAETALALGLVNALLPAERLEAEVLDRARRLAAGPRVALGLMKRNLGLALSTDLEAFMDVEVAHHVATKSTADHAEASRAFVERRTPRFAGC
ncbi:MAG: enoyl-CoA hydratase-related protein, partial [Actinomycetota bacterium]|nr:enoyl-CoA hydratase-related protein [Actinomycetota bacterium]